MKNQKLTHIIRIQKWLRRLRKPCLYIVCDCSASMTNAWYNGLTNDINTILLENKHAYVTVLRFDDRCKIIPTHNHTLGFKPIRSSQLTPNGRTALNDACIQIFKIATEKMKLGHKVKIIIYTDGEENASQKYSNKNFGKEAVTSHVNTLKKNGVDIIFMGANQNAEIVGKSMGIDSHLCLSFDVNDKVARNAAFRSVSRVVRTSAPFTQMERQCSLGNDTYTQPIYKKKLKF